MTASTRVPRPQPGTPEDTSPGERWGLRRAEVLGILGFWTLYGVLTTVNRLLDPYSLRGGAPPGREIVFWLLQSYLWAVVTLIVFAVMGRFVTRHAKLIVSILGLVALGVVAVVVMNAARDVLRFHVLRLPQRAAPATLMQWLFRPWLLNDVVTYTGVVAAGFARVYFLRDRARQEETTRLQAHTSQLQAQLAEARLDALRMQINPHFLFNTLHAISSLVERDPRGVRRMIARLSELLRHTLNGAGEPEVMLEEEIDLLGRYLDILQVRFQGKLEVETELEPGTSSALVPNLILQPLVENAVKHGVSNLVGVGRIWIGARREGGRLVLWVRDNGPGPQPSSAGDFLAPEGTGVGLRNVRERLAELYGDDQSFELHAGEDGGAVAEISLPLHTREELRSGASPAEPAEAFHEA